ncbi:TetR/AcrR family transcriptional regulator [Sphaerospermopsis aphanizomenoides BCCUSP55]|uniref:TetR/AcrR family transcriptional regulator n=1 Tax=Sphaerospermopsis aphanizomenoides TaxID=459663 RepID=UPI000AD3D5A9|nr:TetR/AcrR family transcriptional regulator [Sphaerospermopsis aphanizomenoides]MBK1989140.1 TetR/AcrR family transcriptional regulator [Sphaerospermopsis aphanizomenoides BCCUSP55]
MPKKSRKIDTERLTDKVDAILAGAMQEFLVHGYSAATMDRVTEAAGVSKTTIYSYFQDKEGLFTALIEGLARKKYLAVFNPQDPQFLEGEPEIVLRRIANNILDNITCSQELLSFVRLIIAESGRFPSLAQVFVRNVDKNGLDTITEYFSAHPELQLPDAQVAARIFLGTLVHFTIIQYMLHGADILPMERDRLIDNLVNLMTCNQIDIHGGKYSGTRHKSPRRKRTSEGKFQADYGDETKKLRSIRLTDTAWAKLDELAQEHNLTRSEMIEVFARQGFGDGQESGD